MVFLIFVSCQRRTRRSRRLCATIDLCASTLIHKMLHVIATVYAGFGGGVKRSGVGHAVVLLSYIVFVDAFPVCASVDTIAVPKFEHVVETVGKKENLRIANKHLLLLDYDLMLEKLKKSMKEEFGKQNASMKVF